MSVERRNLLSLADLPGDELVGVLDLAARMKAHGPDPSLLAGRQIALLFLNPSLRTRTSMELAARSLGAHAVVLSPGQDAWKLETRRGATMDGEAAEHLVDAVRVLSRMVDLIGVRTFAGLRDLDEDWREPVLSTVVAESTRPVVNLESALDHPLQALADLMTLRERVGPDLTGVPVALTWAPHPKPLPLAVAAAFLRGAARMGMDVRVAAPPEFSLPQLLIAEALGATGDGGAVRTFTDPARAAKGAVAIQAKSWAAPALLQDRAADAAARARHGNWTVDERLMAMGDDAIFLHCLPVRRNVVVTDDVLDGPRSAVYDQAENRLHTARAVLATLLGPVGGPS